MLERLDDLESQRKSFAFESTLASQALARRLGRLKKRGYRVHIVYLWLPTVELALARVAERVRAGGHDVPADDGEAAIRSRTAATFSRATGRSQTRGASTMRSAITWSAARRDRAVGEANASCAIKRPGAMRRRGMIDE